MPSSAILLLSVCLQHSLCTRPTLLAQHLPLLDAYSVAISNYARAEPESDGSTHANPRRESPKIKDWLSVKLLP